MPSPSFAMRTAQLFRNLEVDMSVQQGMNQQSPAVQHLISKAMGKVRTKVRRKATAAVRKATGTRKKAKRKIAFGSPAWQKKYKVGKYAK